MAGKFQDFFSSTKNRPPPYVRSGLNGGVSVFSPSWYWSSPCLIFSSKILKYIVFVSFSQISYLMFHGKYGDGLRCTEAICARRSRGTGAKNRTKIGRPVFEENPNCAVPVFFACLCCFVFLSPQGCPASRGSSSRLARRTPLSGSSPCISPAGDPGNNGKQT